jgi:hypothetical protein
LEGKASAFNERGKHTSSLQYCGIKRGKEAEMLLLYPYSIYGKENW